MGLPPPALPLLLTVGLALCLQVGLQASLSQSRAGRHAAGSPHLCTPEPHQVHWLPAAVAKWHVPCSWMARVSGSM